MTKSQGHTEYVIAPAEYRWVQDRSWARASFLRAIEAYTPSVLADLQTRVLPVYRPYHPRSAKARRTCKKDPEWSHEVMTCIMAEVTCWADDFNLRGCQPGSSGSLALFDWMEETIVHTLLEWQADPQRPLTWGCLPQYSIHASFACPPPFLPEIDGWVRQRETEAAFLHRACNDFESQLQHYVKERRKESDGLVPIPHRMASSHFAYLALYQCLRYSHSQISQQFRRRRNTIGAGIQTAVEAVIGNTYKDWLMPPLPAGRKKKKGLSLDGRDPF